MVMLAPKKPPSQPQCASIGSLAFCLPISPVEFARLLTAMPPRCHQCGCHHERDLPHDRDTFIFQVNFQHQHKRPPTWSDAMAHCSRSVRVTWRHKLRAIYASQAIELPADLAVERDPKIDG